MAGTAPTAGWRAQAACRSMPVSLFFPPDESSRVGSPTAAQAKAVCARCAVRAACLAYALAAGEPPGIWGGTTSEERRAIRRHPRQLG